jgi:hypothetical protein
MNPLHTDWLTKVQRRNLVRRPNAVGFKVIANQRLLQLHDKRHLGVLFEPLESVEVLECETRSQFRCNSRGISFAFITDIWWPLQVSICRRFRV